MLHDKISASVMNVALFTAGVEFLLHLKSCLSIIRHKNRSQTDQLHTKTKAIEEQREIEEMIISETVEALVPLAYAANFAIAM